MTERFTLSRDLLDRLTVEGLTTMTHYTDMQIARVIHEANRALQIVNGEDNISPSFRDAPDWMVDSIIDGIERASEGFTPEQMHESWCEARVADGWVYGPAKDEQAKTHPCLVPYDALPADQRVKDALFLAIVGALSEP